MSDPITFTPRGREYYSPGSYDAEGAMCQAAPLRKLSDAERADYTKAQDAPLEQDVWDEIVTSAPVAFVTATAGAIVGGATMAAAIGHGMAEAGIHAAGEALWSAVEHFADVASDEEKR